MRHVWVSMVAALFATTATVQSSSAQETIAASQNVGSPSGVLRRSWEGFMQDRSYDQFVTLDLRPQSDGSGGTFQVLGQLIPVNDVIWARNRLTARVGQPADKLSIVATREGDWLSGELREGSNSQRFRLQLIPQYPVPQNRAERWGQDLDALAGRFASLDRSLSPGERTHFLEALNGIRSNLDKLSDAEVIMQMAAAIAIADEPHTRLLLVRNATELRRLPIRVWWFQEGLYVIRSTPGIAICLAAGSTISIMFRRVRPAISSVGPSQATLRGATI
ncbi:hypothetical protein BH24PSE1_BH24PSE1_01410 [soil metagenome]